MAALPLSSGVGAPLQAATRSADLPLGTKSEHAVALSKPRANRATTAAAGLEGYFDFTGDSGQAIDIQSITVSDDGLEYAFEIQMANQQSLAPLDRLFIILDIDSNPRTGNLNQRGAEFFIDIDGDGFNGGPAISLARWNGFEYESLPADGNIAGSDGNPLLAVVNRGTLGNPATFNFYAHAVFPDSAGVTPDFDLLPDADPAQNTTTVMYPDDLGPLARAMRSRPQGGSRNILSYVVDDDSGYADWQLEVVRAGTTNRTFVRQFAYQAGATFANVAEFFEDWRVPANIKGYQDFCIRAFDAAGNASRRSCKPVVFKRIKSDVQLSRTFDSRGIRVKFLKLIDLPKKTKVSVKCVSGCSFSETKTVSGTFNSSKFRGKTLRKGAVVVARATKARYVGHYEKLVIGNSSNAGLKSETQKCLPPGLTSPAKCR